MVKNQFGVWSIRIPDDVGGNPAIPHNSRVKFRFKHGDGVWVDRIPAGINYATQDATRFAAPYDGIYWDPPPSERPGDSYCIRTTYDDNAITNVVEIYASDSGAVHFIASNNDCGAWDFDMEHQEQEH
ncbi:hypothetical protein OROHE_010094 [Orobanche hederae]